jgi:hypothetical protein
MAVVAIGAPVLLIRTWMKKYRLPMVFRQVQSQVPSNVLLKRALGDPIVASKKWRGSIEASTAAFDFDVEGSTGKGHVKIQALKQGSGWLITSARFAADGSSRLQKLDLKDD